MAALVNLSDLQNHVGVESMHTVQVVNLDNWFDDLMHEWHIDNFSPDVKVKNKVVTFEDGTHGANDLGGKAYHKVNVDGGSFSFGLLI